MRLCREFRVSRSTIQKVIERLKAEGRIVSRRGGGTFVAGRPLSETNNTVAVMCILHLIDFSRLQERALQANHLLCVYNQHEHEWQAEQEKVFLEQVKAARHRGLLAFCSPRPPLHDELLAEIADSGTRVIHLSPYRAEPLSQEYLFADYHKVGYLAGASLMARRSAKAGKGVPERIYMAGFSEDGPYVQLMRDGFCEALTPFGIKFDPAEHWLEASEFWEEKTGPTVKRFEGALRKGERISVFARGFEIAETIRRRVRQAFQPDTRTHDQPGKADVQYLAYTHAPVDPLRQGDVDLLLVHTHALIERAMETVLSRDPNPLRERVAPEFVAGRGR
jgi:DNA-binding LacI/PurR family transcriptional regulator